MLDRKALLTWLLPLGPMGSDSPLFPILRPYRRTLPAVAALGVLASLLEGVGVGILVPLGAVLMAGGEATEGMGPLRRLMRLGEGFTPGQRIALVAAAVLAMIVLKGLVQALNARLIARTEGQLGSDLRQALAERAMALSYRQYITHPNARFVAIISSDSWEASKVIRWFFQVVAAGTSLLALCGLLFVLEWRLSLLVAAGAALIAGMLWLTERRMQRYSGEIVASNLALGERMLTLVAAMRVIRVFGQERHEAERFAAASGRVMTAMFRASGLAAWTVPAVELLISVLFVSVLMAGHAMGLSIALISGFLLLLVRAQPHARTISEGRLGIASVRASVIEVEWLLGSAVEREALPATVAAETRIEGTIRFEGVRFTYPNGTSGLHDASFALEDDTITALIGRSGSGKSTVVNLLCRLIEPDAGTIAIDGRPIAACDARAWRARIALAGQDAELLDGTLGENIGFGRTGATREEIVAAARAAGADAFIRRLPEGYDTTVSIESAILSGGQRQRIGLARALLRRPDLLILDEATSAVDGISEGEILELLADHRHFRRALVISHRRSTLAVCQQGIVLDEGRVIEAGPLKALEYYRAMARYETPPA